MFRLTFGALLHQIVDDLLTDTGRPTGHDGDLARLVGDVLDLVSVREESCKSSHIACWVDVSGVEVSALAPGSRNASFGTHL